MICLSKNKKVIKWFNNLEENLSKIDKFSFNMEDFVYENAGSKMECKCITCNKVSFKRVSTILKGYGCKYCRVDDMKNKGLESLNMYGVNFIEKLTRRYPSYIEKFDFSKFIFSKHHEKSTVICKKHNIEFLISPSNLYQRECCGCEKCRTESKLLTEDEYIKQIIERFPENKFLYNYDLINYKGDSKKITIFCNKCNVFFEQQAGVHKRGCGCKVCASSKNIFDIYKDKPTYLYYISIGDYFKVGVSKSKVSYRYSGRYNPNNCKITIISEVLFQDGYEAWCKEQKILQLVNYDKVSKEECPIKGGFTEVRKSDFKQIFDKIVLEEIIK